MNGPRKSTLRIALGSAAGAVLVWWLFRDTDWRAVAEILGRVDGRWILASQALLWSSHFLRVQRWTEIVQAARPVRYRTVFGAAQVGFLFNVILPLRLGEGVRAVYLSRHAGLPVATGMALVALDRVTDMIGMLSLALVATLAFPADRDVVLPPGVVSEGESFVVSATLLKPLVAGAALVLGIVLAVLVLLHARRAAALEVLERRTAFLPTRLAEPLRRAAAAFAAGMRIFDDARGMLRAVIWSLAGWGFAALSLACVLRAFEVPFAWWVPLALQAMLALFSSAPIVPGLIGQFHLAVIACLLIAVPGTELAQARAIAIATHLLALLPVVVLGVYCLISDRAGDGRDAVSTPAGERRP